MGKSGPQGLLVAGWSARLRLIRAAAAFLALALVLASCSQTPPSPSPAAVAFHQEIYPLLQELQQNLAQLVAQRAVAEIDTYLEKFFSRHGKLCRDCPMQVGVIDGEGQLLTSYPKQSLTGNFAAYRLISEPLQRRRIVQGQVFMPSGLSTLNIAAPLFKKGRAVGVLVLNFSATEVEKRWGLTVQEFLNLDLNQAPQ